MPFGEEVIDVIPIESDGAEDLGVDDLATAEHHRRGKYLLTITFIGLCAKSFTAWKSLTHCEWFLTIFISWSKNHNNHIINLI
jgi:hypothetical protein